MSEMNLYMVTIPHIAWIMLKACVYVTTIMWLVSLYITLYKVPLTMVQPYYEFPWQGTDGVISRSHPAFLLCHTISALVLLTLSWLLLVVRSIWANSEFALRVYRVRTVVHWIFCGLVLTSCWNLSDLSPANAIAVNVGLVLLLVCARRTVWIYFLVLSIAPMFELWTLVWTYIHCRYMYILAQGNYVWAIPSWMVPPCSFWPERV